MAALVSVALTVLLYGGTLALPLYSDDLLQVPWTETTSLPDLWCTLNPYQRYRPFQFTLWKLVMLIGGDLRLPVLHGLNLAGHALCGTLAGLLVIRAKNRSWLAAPLTAALFAGFPFAFDVVSWPCALAYPLTVALTLGALLIYLQARETGSWRQHLLAAVLTALAGFAYEAGVVAGVTILLAEITIVRKRSWFWPAIHLAASAIPLLFIIRFASAPTDYLTGLHPAYNLIIALQAVAFPIAPLARVVGRIGMDPVVTMGWAGVLTILLLGYGAHRAGQLRWFCFGLIWVLLWDAIPLLTLPFNWFRDPPRVLYPSAVGIAMMWWAGLFSARLRGPTWWRRFVQVALCLGALLPALFFLRGRTALYRRAGDLLWDVIAVADGDAPVLLVNLPGRITPGERFYPLGHEGVIPLPPPTDVGVLVQVHTGRVGAAFGRDGSAILPLLPYSIEPVGPPLAPNDLRTAGRILLVAFRPDGMDLEEPGAVLPSQEPGPAEAQFGQQILLLSASCERVGLDQVVLSTRWQALEAVDGMPTVFAHLWGADDTLVAQADGDLLRGLYPFRWWEPGEVVHDVRVFDGVSSDPVAVSLGVWDPTAGERWPATGPDEKPLYDNAFRCAVQDGVRSP